MSSCKNIVSHIQKARNMRAESVQVLHYKDDGIKKNETILNFFPLLQRVTKTQYKSKSQNFG